MADDRLTTLYSWLEEMTKAGEQVKEKHEDNYKTIIEYVKTSNTKERILAAQLIVRFFKYFPAYEEPAFDSIVDLCESVDVDVRKHATMAMTAICKDCKHLVSKAADILIQLYQTNQASEVNLINQSLTTLLNLDIQKFLQSFFTNFEDGTETVRERALKFLSTKIHMVDSSALTKEVEASLLNYSKKAMEDVTKDEFITFIGVLTKLKTAKTASGQKLIVSVIKSQAELDKEFDVNNTDILDKFLLCTKHSIPLFSQYNRASEYINYICLKILPHLGLLAKSGNDLNVLQALAEMSPYTMQEDITGNLVDLEKCLRIVYDKLMEYLKLPQEHKIEPSATNETQSSTPTTTLKDGGDPTEQAASPAAAAQERPDEEKPAQVEVKEEKVKSETKLVSSSDVETTSKTQEVDFQFTHIEYLVYTIHQFGRLLPEFLISVQGEMKQPLTHLSLGCRKYMDILSAQLRAVKSQDLKKEENKLRSVALRTTKNISVLLRDFLKIPPQYKSNVLLSCKPLTSSPVESNPPPDVVGNNNNSSSNNKQAQEQQVNKGHQQQNNGNKPNMNRQAGHKHKHWPNYHQGERNNNQKRMRHAR